MTSQTTSIMDITAEQIAQVYSGRPGCGCGCRGTYRSNPAFLARNDARRGYPQENANMAQVRRVLRSMQARAGEVESAAWADETIYALEDDAHYYWAYVPTA